MVVWRKERKEYDDEACLQIYNEYKNTNISAREISHKYDITPQTFFNIKKKIEKRIEESKKQNSNGYNNQNIINLNNQKIESKLELQKKLNKSERKINDEYMSLMGNVENKVRDNTKKRERKVVAAENLNSKWNGVLNN